MHICVSVVHRPRARLGRRIPESLFQTARGQHTTADDSALPLFVLAAAGIQRACGRRSFILLALTAFTHSYLTHSLARVQRHLTPLLSNPHRLQHTTLP